MSEREMARILIVDDEPALRELLVDALAAEGLQVVSAGSGQEALDLARADRPDVLVTDLRLGDFDGVEVIERIRSHARREVPAVVITGYHDAGTLTRASRCRPVELMTKPLDVERLRATVRHEVARQLAGRCARQRARRLRRLARQVNLERKKASRTLGDTCEGLTTAYRTLSGRLALQQIVLEYQRELIEARTDDDVFKAFFQLVARRSGPVFGVALVCDADAELQIVGRFGVPLPDNSTFCQAITRPMIAAVLADPRCILLDAEKEAELFEEPARRYLPGVSILAVPLMPSDGELIGLVILYRKGEQPFMQSDLALADAIAAPTALAVRRNE